MKIEFCGLPGSGKTYLAKKYARENDYKYLSIHHFLEEYFFAFLFFLLHPRFAIFFRNLFLKENKHDPKLRRYKMRKLFLSYLATEQKSRFYKNCVVDEGLIYSPVSIFERDIEGKDLKWLSDFFAERKPHIFVVDSPLEDRVGRMKKRGRFPRDKFGDQYAALARDRFEKTSKSLVKYYSKHFDVEVIKN